MGDGWILIRVFIPISWSIEHLSICVLLTHSCFLSVTIINTYVLPSVMRWSWYTLFIAHHHHHLKLPSWLPHGSVFFLSAEGCDFKPCPGQTKDFKLGIKDWLWSHKIFESFFLYSDSKINQSKLWISCLEHEFCAQSTEQSLMTSTESK